MRWILLVGVVSGCGFSVPAASTVDAGQGQGGNMPIAGDGDAGIIGNAICDVTDPSVRLCLTFDGQPMVQDLSSYRHPITPPATSVTSILRDGNPAASFTTQSRVRIAETPDLDLGELTIEMWIAPQQPIAQQAAYWMLDNNTQYFMAYEGSHKLRCGIAGQTIDTDSTIDDSNWHHVACTYKPAQQGQGQLIGYVDGTASCGKAGPVPTGGRDGTAIGANHSANSDTQLYLGGLDNLHIYSRALTPAEICTNAQQTRCNADCTTSGQNN